MQCDPLPSKKIPQDGQGRNPRPGFVLGTHMTRSASSTYNAILDAAERNELIAIETGEETYGVTILCAMSTDAFRVTPLAWTYGAESMQSELVTFGNDDDKLVQSLCRTAILSIKESCGVGAGELIKCAPRATLIPSEAAAQSGGEDA